MKAHLLVEGNNDKHVIWALCQSHDISKAFDVLDKDNDQGVLESLRLYLRGSAGDTSTLGVVLDADVGPDQRWQQLRDIVEKANLGYNIPTSVDPTGVIIDAPNVYRPRLGVWLMPNNMEFGSLEDFVRVLIPVDDKLSPFADDVLNTIEAQNLHHYRGKRNKAFIHTWLAWQREPGLPMGSAITATALSAQAEIAVTFVNWLNRLFNA